jgi:murein DD-endopeptidase MepM/ murein hydrolase activator NlpD
LTAKLRWLQFTGFRQTGENPPFTGKRIAFDIENRGRMGSKHYTLILVHNEGSRFRKWRASLAQLTGIAGLVLLSAVGAAFSVWFYFAGGAGRAELADLQRENETLRAANGTFESRLAGLQERLVDSEERTRQLAIVAGLENLGGSSEAGVGGTSMSDPDGGDAIAGSELRSLRLWETLDQVENRLHENLQLISATPSITPVRGIFTSTFGYRRDPLSGQRAFHSGVDISAPPGKPVKVSAAGVVVKTEEYGGLGRAVHVAHGFGVNTVYGHLSRVTARPGQKVERGDVVGLVGNTGRATGYHLHYEVQVNGRAVDPLTYMVDRSAGAGL